MRVNSVLTCPLRIILLLQQPDCNASTAELLLIRETPNPKDLIRITPNEAKRLGVEANATLTYNPKG